jgi:hypothetical protein
VAPGPRWPRHSVQCLRSTVQERTAAVVQLPPPFEQH